tara:strand:- start:7565 stop:8356 length:792 start_codon:yes stop_codon:yes gene_type:complete
MPIKTPSIVKLLLPLTAVASLGATSCKSDDDKKTETKPEAAAVATATTPTAETKPEVKEWNSRRLKELTEPSEEKFGTLAEGVGIAVGQPAPNASVTDDEGKSLELQSLWEEGSVLLVFYRGGWCPYCNSQMRDLTTFAPEFTKRGITPVAISVDSIDETVKTQKTYDIPFPILSDPDLAAHNAWNVTIKVGDEEFEKLKSHGIDVEKASGKEHRTIGIPSMFLIDKTGTVLWAHGDPSYKIRPRAEHILRVLDAGPRLTTKQ